MLRFPVHTAYLSDISWHYKMNQLFQRERRVFFGSDLWSWICGWPEHKNICIKGLALWTLEDLTVCGMAWRLLLQRSSQAWPRMLNSNFLACLCKPACLLGTYQDTWAPLQLSLESTAQPVAGTTDLKRRTNSVKVSTPALLLNQQHMFLAKRCLNEIIFPYYFEKFISSAWKCLIILFGVLPKKRNHHFENVVFWFTFRRKER